MGRPDFQSRGAQIHIFKGFWDLWTENRGTPKTPNSTTTDLTPHFRPSKWGKTPLPPPRNHYINNSLGIIFCSDFGPHYIDFFCNDTEAIPPRRFLCNGQPHQLHTAFLLSKCSFLMRIGLHEEICNEPKSNSPELFYACTLKTPSSLISKFEVFPTH